jgi:hypothetical protein
MGGPGDQGHDQTRSHGIAAARGESGACIEIASVGQSIAVRDSESPEGLVLTCTSRQWEVFVAAAKDGAFGGEA